MSQDYLVVNGIFKTYPPTEKGKGKLETLNGVSLAVKKGEFVSIIGPSGCGKSTLFNIISGLEKPDKGQVLLDKKDITGEKGHISYMMQKDLLLPWRTVRDNCILGPELQGITKKEAYRLALPLLKEFNLLEFASSYPAQLSGGMRQRVAFLRTVLAKKELLLLDEPFGALDAYTKADMQDWLSGIWSKYRETVLFITHDVEEAIFLSDRVYVFSKRPALVKAEIIVDIPRPRSRGEIISTAFMELKKELISLLLDV